MHKTHYLLENFHGASGPCHYVLYTATDSRGKLSRLAKNHENRQSFPSKVLLNMVFPTLSVEKLNHLHPYLSMYTSPLGDVSKVYYVEIFAVCIFLGQASDLDFYN